MVDHIADLKVITRSNLDNWALSIEAFQWIRTNIPAGSPILEFGSGTGTIELTRFYDVTTVEQNEQYVGLAKDAHYIYAPVVDEWYDTKIVFANIPTEYTLIIIDGPVGLKRRGRVVEHIGKLRQDVPILFDDTHREYDRNSAIEVADHLKKSWYEVKGWQKNFIIIEPN